MGRLVRVVTTVAAPVGALYGFTPIQTEVAITLLALPFLRLNVRRPA